MYCGPSCQAYYDGIAIKGQPAQGPKGTPSGSEPCTSRISLNLPTGHRGVKSFDAYGRAHACTYRQQIGGGLDMDFAVSWNEVPFSLVKDAISSCSTPNSTGNTSSELRVRRL